MTTTITIPRVADTVVVEVTRECPLYEINFEEGDFSEFDWTGGEEDLFISSDAALAGTNLGLKCIINDTEAGGHWGVKIFPDNNRSVKRLRIYFDTSSLVLIDNTGFPFCDLTNNEPWARVFSCQISYTDADGLRLRLAIYNDNGWLAEYYYPISNEEHYVEVLAVQSASPISNDGYYTLWIDGDEKDTFTVDNYNLMDFQMAIFIGLATNIGLSGASGEFYADEFIINDTGTLIGPR